MDDVPFYYFAYGSNLPYLRMLDRTSNDLMLKGTFAWRGHQLTFAKRSQDGSGKCTLIATSDDHLVWGAIYQITPADRQKLARYEVGYHEASLRFPVDGVQKLGFTYIADDDKIDQSLRPYTWYKRFVVVGAHEHGFPRDYIDAIEHVPAMTDPDVKRRAKYEAMLVPIEKAPLAWTAKL